MLKFELCVWITDQPPVYGPCDLMKSKEDGIATRQQRQRIDSLTTARNCGQPTAYDGALNHWPHHCERKD